MKILVLAIVLAGCGVKYVLPPTVPPGEARVEDKVLPPDPETEVLPEGIPNDQRVESIEAGDIAPYGGSLVGEGKAAKLINYVSRYKELRSLYTSDKKVWAVHRELYETRLVLADKAIKDLQPTWWERNQLSFGVLGGLTLGVLVMVAGIAIAN